MLTQANDPKAASFEAALGSLAPRALFHHEGPRSSNSLKTSLATSNGAATSRALEGPPSYARTLPRAETALLLHT